MAGFTIKDILWRMQKQNDPHYSSKNFRPVDSSLNRVSTVSQIPNLIVDPVLNQARAEEAFYSHQLSRGHEIFQTGRIDTSADEQNRRLYQQETNTMENTEETDDLFSSHDDFINEAMIEDFFDDDMSMSFEEVDDLVSEPEMTFNAECIGELENQDFIDSGIDCMANEPIEDMGMPAYEQEPIEEMMEMEEPEPMMDFDPMDPMMNPFDPMNPFGMMDPCEMMLSEPWY